jgi:hypothetical protein
LAEFSVMRLVFLFCAAALAASPAFAEGRGLQRDREQNSAYRAMQQGRIMSLPEIRERLRVPGAQYIGAEVLAPGIYRLKYMRGADVIWIDVDARTGRIIGRQ